jgi:hypothetical protein
MIRVNRKSLNFQKTHKQTKSVINQSYSSCTTQAQKKFMRLKQLKICIFAK